LESTEEIWGSHTYISRILTTNLDKDAHISISLTIRRDISSQISLEFAFTDRKANTFIDILKVNGKW